MEGEVKINTLIKKRTELLNRQDKIIKQYKLFKNDEKKILNSIKEEYSQIRESILEVEDEICKIDWTVLEEIIEPNPECIDEAIKLFTDNEFEKIKI